MQTYIFGDARSGFVADINTSVLLEGYPFNVMTVSNLESAMNRKQNNPDAIVLLSETLLKDADISKIPYGAYAYSHTPEGEEYIASIGMTSLGIHKTSSSLLSVLDEEESLPEATPPHAPIQAVPEVPPMEYDMMPPVAPSVPAPNGIQGGMQQPMYPQQPYEAPVQPVAPQTPYTPTPAPAPTPYPQQMMPPMNAPAQVVPSMLVPTPPAEQPQQMPQAPEAAPVPQQTVETQTPQAPQQTPQNPAMPAGMTPEMMQMMMQMMQQMQAAQQPTPTQPTPPVPATPTPAPAPAPVPQAPEIPQPPTPPAQMPQQQTPYAPSPVTPVAPAPTQPTMPKPTPMAPQAPMSQKPGFGQTPPPFPNAGPTPSPKAPYQNFPPMQQPQAQPQPMAPKAPYNQPFPQAPQTPQTPQPQQAYPQWPQNPQMPQTPQNNAWGQPNPYNNPVQPTMQTPMSQQDADLGIVRPQAQFPERSGGSEIRGRKRKREQQVTDAAINQDLAGYGSPEPQGTKVITVYAAKGGVGKTTISTELAVCLALTSNGRRRFRVCIVDYNIDFGDVATTLELRDDGPNMSYWASEIREKITRGEDPNEINFTRQQMEERYLHRMNETGLYALTAPIAHEDSMLIKSDELKIMLRNIIDNGEFDFVVCDTGNNTRDSSIIAIDNSDYVFLVCTQDVTTANCNASVLRTLQDSSFDTNKIRLIINNVISSRDTGISVQEIEETFPYPCICRIKRTPNVIWANNNAKPVVYKQNHEFTKQLRKVVEYVTAGEGVADVPKSRGLFGH